MIFTPADLAGAWLIGPESYIDDQGSFARIWCAREFADQGLTTSFSQASIWRTHKRGSLPGMHRQAPPHAEDKLVRCTRGSVWDVIIDLRPDSRTHLRHVSVVLDAEEGRALFVPKGFAHGFQTLEDDVEILYHMTAFYEPSAGRGARWDDPAFRIQWPVPDPILNFRDASYPDWTDVA